jgi:tRNA G18 (ribose-2'-O)-methylase SpoU
MDAGMQKLTFQDLQRLSEERRRGPGAKAPVSVLLDDIRSLHNVGAIFRTADAAGLEQLFLCGITGTPPRSEIRKTSLGAEEVVPWSYHPRAIEPLQLLKQQGCQIVALEQTTASVDYRSAPFRFPLCLIIGHEYQGINDQLLSVADLAIELPMRGLKHSLNVSVAFGIAIYEICHRWHECEAGPGVERE